MEIPIGKVGKILKGEAIGSFVQVLDDAENTGGYLILTAKQQDMKGCFDDWVESKEALSRFFAEAGWLIEWL